MSEKDVPMLFESMEEHQEKEEDAAEEDAAEEEEQEERELDVSFGIPSSQPCKHENDIEMHKMEPENQLGASWYPEWEAKQWNLTAYSDSDSDTFFREEYVVNKSKELDAEEQKKEEERAKMYEAYLNRIRLVPY